MHFVTNLLKGWRELDLLHHQEAIFLGFYFWAGYSEAVISTKIVSSRSPDYWKLCSARKRHLRYCGRTTATALDFPELAVNLKVFVSAAVLDCDWHLVAIGTRRRASLEVLMSLVLRPISASHCWNEVLSYQLVLLLKELRTVVSLPELLLHCQVSPN